jgi:hypothetical protein
VAGDDLHHLPGEIPPTWSCQRGRHVDRIHVLTPSWLCFGLPAVMRTFPAPNGIFPPPGHYPAPVRESSRNSVRGPQARTAVLRARLACPCGAC